MAVAYNPSIVTNGLVLALDAGNNKSHSTNRFISYGSGLVTENVTFLIQGTGTFQRVAAGTVVGGYTVKATDVVYSYALGTTGCHYHGNSIPIPTGVSATFSFDYLVTGATTYPITDYLANFESALSGAITTANATQNIWQRRTLTAGPTGAAGTLNAYLYPGNCANGRLADSGTIYYRNPKVEFTNADTTDGNFSSMSSNLTTWTNLTGTGNNGTLTNGPYHIIGSDGSKGYMSFDGTDDFVTSGALSGSFSSFTVIIWFYPTSVTNYQNPIDCNYAYNGSTGNIGPRLEMATGGALAWNYSNDTATNSNFYSHPVVSSGLAVNTWHCAAITYNGATSTTYYNGNATGLSRTVVGTPTGFVGVLNNVTIGKGFHLGGAERIFAGRVSNTQIYNRALSAAEIQQNFNATRGRFGI